MIFGRRTRTLITFFGSCYLVDGEFVSRLGINNGHASRIQKQQQQPNTWKRDHVLRLIIHLLNVIVR